MAWDRTSDNINNKIGNTLQVHTGMQNSTQLLEKNGNIVDKMCNGMYNARDAY